MAISFTPFEPDALRARLEAESDEGYRRFHSSLLPGVEGILGVRMPRLRALSRELLAGDWRGLLARTDRSCYEAVMIEALVIAGAPVSYEEKLELIERFIPHIGNWAVCDYFCEGLDVLAERPGESFAFLGRQLAGAEEFRLRFAVVCLLCFFTDEAHIDRLLERYGVVRHEGYYLRMGVAWALCEAYIFFEDKTAALLETAALDDFTHRRALQKIVESFRVSPEGKARARALKRPRKG